ncbi:hypothetical protein GJ688_13875 [Heliobacillus mobilis]|uniref:Uncharacterized protein n=1 Tax=Heliobacterium mobile TaxID=28064 RepID=A0A6I3SM72_HELMO|nr:hypothetical protein [Heliobacterium mobile]MTV50060.1 hypothetical protein [Heliobacterium mobile]
MEEQLLRQILTEIQALKAGQEKMAGDIDEIKTDVHSLKAGQRELYDLTKSLEHRQEETTAQLTTMAEDINFIKGSVSRLEEGQQKTQVVVDALCRRSIEQEETLRRVK